MTPTQSAIFVKFLTMKKHLLSIVDIKEFYRFYYDYAITYDKSLILSAGQFIALMNKHGFQRQAKLTNSGRKLFYIRKPAKFPMKSHNSS